MPWQQSIQDVRMAHLRANRAELTREWHIATHHWLFCFEEARAAGDSRAARYYASKLSAAYGAMSLPHKASYYRSLG